MSKWRWLMARKANEHAAAPAGSFSTSVSGRSAIGKLPREPRRVRYDARMSDPQGWRSTFMSF